MFDQNSVYLCAYPACSVCLGHVAPLFLDLIPKVSQSGVFVYVCMVVHTNTKLKHSNI